MAWFYEYFVDYCILGLRENRFYAWLFGRHGWFWVWFGLTFADLPYNCCFSTLPWQFARLKDVVRVCASSFGVSWFDIWIGGGGRSRGPAILRLKFSDQSTLSTVKRLLSVVLRCLFLGVLVSSIFEFTYCFSDFLALIVIHRIRLLLPATLLSESLIFTVDHFYFFQNCAVETADVELFLPFLKVCIELVMAF